MRIGASWLGLLIVLGIAAGHAQASAPVVTLHLRDIQALDELAESYLLPLASYVDLNIDLQDDSTESAIDIGDLLFDFPLDPWVDTKSPIVVGVPFEGFLLAREGVVSALPVLSGETGWSALEERVDADFEDGKVVVFDRADKKPLYLTRQKNYVVMGYTESLVRRFDAMSTLFARDPKAPFGAITIDIDAEALLPVFEAGLSTLYAYEHDRPESRQGQEPRIEERTKVSMMYGRLYRNFAPVFDIVSHVQLSFDIQDEAEIYHLRLVPRGATWLESLVEAQRGIDPPNFEGVDPEAAIVAAQEMNIPESIQKKAFFLLPSEGPAGELLQVAFQSIRPSGRRSLPDFRKALKCIDTRWKMSISAAERPTFAVRTQILEKKGCRARVIAQIEEAVATITKNTKRSSALPEVLSEAYDADTSRRIYRFDLQAEGETEDEAVTIFAGREEQTVVLVGGRRVEERAVYASLDGNRLPGTSETDEDDAFEPFAPRPGVVLHVEPVDLRWLRARSFAPQLQDKIKELAEQWEREQRPWVIALGFDVESMHVQFAAPSVSLSMMEELDKIELESMALRIKGQTPKHDSREDEKSPGRDR